MCNILETVAKFSNIVNAAWTSLRYANFHLRVTRYWCLFYEGIIMYDVCRSTSFVRVSSIIIFMISFWNLLRKCNIIEILQLNYYWNKFCIRSFLLQVLMYQHFFLCQNNILAQHQFAVELKEIIYCYFCKSIVVNDISIQETNI